MKVSKSLFWFLQLVEREAAYLEKISKDDVINFYKKYVKVDAPNRAKLAVYVLGKQLDDCEFYFVWIALKKNVITKLQLTYDFL